MNIGVLALGRSTHDIEFAHVKLQQCLQFLHSTSHKIYGICELLLESEPTLREIENLKDAPIDFIIILQATFTDASMTVKIAQTFLSDIGIWSIPEPRLGGRLRLNSFCGLNLASHALGLNDIQFSWLYENPENIEISRFQNFLENKRSVKRLEASYSEIFPSNKAKIIKNKIKKFKIGKIGKHPDGFDTCKYDPIKLKKLSGVSVEEIDLDKLFETAKKTKQDKVKTSYNEIKNKISLIDEVDQSELDLSIRLKSSLESIKENGKFDAFAIRCWPEMFTEYGGAVCGPASLMGENKTPCACEADVYGSLTQLILQEVSGSQVFLTDLVDIDINDNTGVIWHCGQAPISMCDKDFKARATIHTNRKMPLLFEFPLKPGIVTLMRISQAFGQQKMIISKGKILKRDMAFTGTSGVIEFNSEASDVLNDVISSGLEHHMALAYGDHTQMLEEVASVMDLPIIKI